MAKLQIKDKNRKFLKLDENNTGMFLITEKRTILINLGPNKNGSFGMDISKSGYTPIGIIGYKANGQNMSDVAITSAYINGNRIELACRNVASGTISNATEELDILYKAN